MAIEILYAQSYMQTNGQMTVDILLKNMETADIVIGMDMYNTDLPPKIIGPRMVACVPKNTPCYPIRYTNFPFTDPYNIYVRRCISGPNCATSGCTTFSSFVDDTFMGEMVDFGSPGISGVPSKVFGPNAKYPTGMPPSIQATCAIAPPPLPVTLNIQGVTAELSTSDLFPGSEGWTRINVTVTGSGMLDILVDNAFLLTDGPLNPGTTPFTFTYLKMLTAGIKHICVIGKGSTGVVGNQVCTSIVIPPHIVTTPGKSVIFSVIGNGQMSIEVNKVPIVTIFPGESKSVLLKTGNQLGITMIPYIGSTLIGLCDVPQTDCQTLLYQYLDILDENILPQRMVATFTAAPPPPPVGEFTVSSDKTSIQSGDYIVFSGHYKTGGQKIGIHTTYGSVVNTVTNAAGDYKVGSYVTTTSTVKEKLAFYACAEGIISGICPILADISNTIIIDVTPMKYKCSGSPDYTCIKDPAGTYADPDTCRAECKAPPPPIAEATHAFVINLSPLSWANLQGLTDSLPGITTEMARAITLYGWTGWKAIESRIEPGNKLVIYMREPTAAVGSMGRMGRIRSLALPAIAAITAAIGVIAIWALKFGFLILGFYIVNLLTKSVEVAKTQADTEQIRTQTVSDMCKSGQLSPEQCAEALKPPKEKGICETFGFSATACSQLTTGGILIGALVIGYIGFTVLKKAAPSTPSR